MIRLSAICLSIPSPVVEWLWDWKLISLHAIGNVLCLLSFLVLLIVSLFIYRQGNLKGLPSTYPALWRGSFTVLLLLALSYVGSLVSLWVGGSIFWITAINKLLLSIVSLRLVFIMWGLKSQMVIAARLLERFEREYVDSDAARSNKESNQ